MAAPVSFSSVLDGMAKQLAVMLNTEGKNGRKAWEDLHRKLADVASSIADPTMTIEDWLKNLKETGSLVLGYPDAEVLLRQIMGHVEEKLSVQSAADASQSISLLKTLILQVADQLNMTPLRNSVHLDMIDGDTIFAEENVDYMVKYSVELSAPNAPYSVVSIIGAQSSGKSYLLNHLFGTKFPVMDPKKGRSQTTKGILMSRCVEPSMLVLDIEGFDGRERGQDTLFENQAALFALTVSDLLMVNISIFDIGRQQGGGGLLFKTIFQERTKLPPGLTNIVVVLRLYNGETPLEILRHDVMKTLEEMWRSVNKESAAFSDYIEITVVGLPDKDSVDFQKEITALRKLLSEFTRSAKVPASSFSLSSKMLWDQIRQNKKLDIPSHMVLLATLYCQQIVEACIGQLDVDLLKDQESPQGFKEVSNTLLGNIITQYDRETEMYDAVVRDSKRQNMVDKINKIFTEHSRELIRKIQEDTSEQFKDEFVRQLENMEKTDDIYDDHKVKSCIEKFANLCEDLKVFDLEYFHKCCGDLQEKLTSYTVSHILSLEAERARKATEEQKRSDKNIEEMTMKLDQRTEESQRLKEEMQLEEEKHSKEKEEMQREQEEHKREKEEMQREQEKHKREKEEMQWEQEKHKREKEDMERKVQMLEQEKQRREKEEMERRLQTLEQEKQNRAKEEMERRVQTLEQEKLNREKEESERRQQTLQHELEIQKERTRKLEKEQAKPRPSGGLMGAMRSIFG